MGKKGERTSLLKSSAVQVTNEKKKKNKEVKKMCVQDGEKVGKGKVRKKEKKIGKRKKKEKSGKVK